MRGRYTSDDGKTEQKIEIRDDEISNAITTVQKDSLVCIGGGGESWLLRKYKKFYDKHGYIPKYFVPYNGSEITDYHPTITANSYGSLTHSGTVLIIETEENN